MAVPNIPFENFVWLLWSIKESAYKYWQRLTPGLIFSPTRITVSDLDDPTGEDPCAPVYQSILHSVAGRLYSRSRVAADHISTVVSADKHFEQVRTGVAVTDRADRPGQSASVRALLLERLRGVLSFEGDELHVEKGPRGIPHLYKGEKEVGIPISLAHHGQFIAYSFALGAGIP